MLARLFQNWMYATPPVALLLFGLSPFLAQDVALPVFLSLPVYMIHQYEEHDDTRFAAFLNGMMGPERSGLSPGDVWVINVICVWFLLLGVVHAEAEAPGWGVLAGYLLAINALVHVAWALAFKRYNPGLWTTVALFLPLAAWIFASQSAAMGTHVASALVVVGLHAAIMARARRPAQAPITGTMTSPGDPE